MTTQRLALLGGAPEFAQRVPIARPDAFPVEPVLAELRTTLASGQLTNGPRVEAFEAAVRARLRVPEAVALQSCSAGLMLGLRALRVEGEVVLPSFTFCATGHAVLWNGLRPRFVDIDPATLLPTPDAVAQAITPRTGALLLVHTFGVPCHPRAMAEVAEDAELVVAAEGGLATTQDAEAARALRTGRNYGNTPTYDPEFAGLSARMSELHAILGQHSLARLDDALRHRAEVAALFRKALGDLPGLAFPSLPKGAQSTHKDLAVLVDPARFGTDRGTLARALAADGVETRPYFDPPLHAQRVFRGVAHAPLPGTELAAQRVLCLPGHGHVDASSALRIAGLVRAVHEHAAELREGAA
ncbi:MAG: DegT/DnrJ/EryC1/StrS family aminotransferase [Halobacteriales archaeon]|nr:DegT/DnrJ/EryC1/StrS family aminotransferase [Halobacteriales archaeon]